MFTRLYSRKSLEDSESKYREFYLKADINQAKLALALFTIPIVGFAFNDYMFFGFSDVFFELVAVRLTVLLIMTLGFVNIGKVKSFRTYDRAIFGIAVSIMIGGGIISASRPSNFIFSSIIAIVSVFILYLVVPLNFRYQILLASITTLGEGLIIVMLSTAETPTLYTLLFSMFVANIIAAFSSWKMHSYRRRTYKESVQREKLQEELEKHASQLSSLVEDRTRDLVEAQNRLVQSERLAAIGELAGMVGHDLRNPLAAIRNSAYFIRKKYGGSMSEAGNEMLNAIDMSIDHADSIINDLLDYSREMILKLEKNSPKSLVDSSLSAISWFEPLHKIEILDHTHSSPTFLADSNKIERVFTNLIKNSVEAMPDGGTLEIDSRQNGENVEFVFTDTGNGMSQDVMNRIFKPLFTTKAQGMGFGLAICKRIVEAHKGEITVQSTLNRGTSFTVKLPIDPKVKNGGEMTSSA